MRVYLAGPINGATDAESKDWRNEATLWLGNRQIETIDPMARDYRGIEDMNVQKLVDADKADIRHSDTLLAYCPKPSVGTSMEILYAWQFGLTIVIVVPTGRVSPWLTYHADHLTDSLTDGLAFISNR